MENEKKIEKPICNGTFSILEEVESERKRIARELHDSTIQMLTMLIYKAELCDKLVEKDTIRTKIELQLMIQVLRESIDDIRDTIYNLHPMSIDDLGLIASLERYIIIMNQNTDIVFSMDVCGEEEECSSIVKLSIYRIVQECCSNIRKHSKGTNANIHLEYIEDELVLSVKDNGHGIDDIHYTSNDDCKHGYGIPMMRERVSLLGGKMNIITGSDGTNVKVNIPLSFSLEENNE